MVAAGDPMPWLSVSVTVASGRLVFKLKLVPVAMSEGGTARQDTA